MGIKTYYHYLHLRPNQLKAAIKKCPIAYIPFGALEWHGEHLPFGMDGIKAEKLCLRAIERTGGILFPCDHWGAFRTVKFPYTINSSKSCILKRTSYVLEQLYSWGFRVIVLLTGHYPPPWVKFLQKVTTKFHKKHEDAFAIGGPEYIFATDMGYIGDHAAKWETAISLALFPEFTDLNDAPEGLSYVDRAANHAIWGFDPKIHATPELGTQVVEKIVLRLSDAVNEARNTRSQKPFEKIYNQCKADLRKVHSIDGAMKYSRVENRKDIIGILKWMHLERKNSRTKWQY